MGCVQGKPRGRYLLITTNEDITLEREHVVESPDHCKVYKKKTPTSYLINSTLLLMSAAPPFVKTFIYGVNNKAYEWCQFHQNKDIYFFKKTVCTVEYTNQSYYIERHRLFSKLKTLKKRKHLVIPNKMFYIPHTEHKGIVIQRMEHCKGGDMFEFMMDVTKQLKCLHTIVYNLASTLHELHQNDVYLTDIKPENIFIGDVFKFGDIECAFMDRRFLTEDEVKDKQCVKNFTKKRWVRTSKYLPDKVYPLTRRLAIRNDIYALFLTIGTFISNKYFDVYLKVFAGKDDLTLPLSPLWLNELKEEAPQLLDHPYIKTILNSLYRPDCITETTLLEIIKMAYINKLRAE